MNETCEQATDFLSDLVKELDLDLSVTSEWTEEGCWLKLSGGDAHFALAENGEMLDAFETVLFQALLVWP